MFQQCVVDRSQKHDAHSPLFAKAKSEHIFSNRPSMATGNRKRGYSVDGGYTIDGGAGAGGDGRMLGGRTETKADPSPQEVRDQRGQAVLRPHVAPTSHSGMPVHQASCNGVY